MASPLVSSRAAADELLVAREKQPLVPRVAGHYKDLAETGNRARKVSGNQGKGSAVGA